MKNLREEMEHLLVAMQDGNMARRMVIDEILSLFRQQEKEIREETRMDMSHTIAEKIKDKPYENEVLQMLIDSREEVLKKLDE